MRPLRRPPNQSDDQLRILPWNGQPQGEDHVFGFSDDLFHISDCVAKLMSWDWWIEREHVELDGDGHSNGDCFWMVRCSQGNEQFVAQGKSPLMAYRQAIKLARLSAMGTVVAEAARQHGV
jgi:hypothetical protein